MLLHRRDASSAHFAANAIGWQVLGPALGCTLLAAIVVATRWYTRCKIAKCSGLDDWVILLSLLLSCTMTAIIGVEVHDGLGIHTDHISATTIAKLVVVNNDLWILIVNITKASILLQYLRIFCCIKLRILCIILLIFLIPAATWGVFGGTFLCAPIAKLWTPTLPGECMNARNYWFSVAGLDIGLDLLIFLLPMPAIARLRLPRKQKIGLVLVFALGFLVCIVSVFRMVTVLVTNLQGDYVASGIWAIVWSAVEANVGIICASLLALKPLLVELFPSLMDESADEPPTHSTRLATISAPMHVTMGRACPARLDSIAANIPRSTARSTTSSSRVSKVESRLSTAKTVSYGGSACSPRGSEGRESAVSEPAWHEGLEVHRERLSIYDMLKEDMVDSLR